MGITDEIKVSKIANVLPFRSFCLICLFSRFRRHCGYAKLASNVTTQNNCLICDHFAEKNRRFDRGGGVLPYRRLMGMCRWMGSHFQGWIDYNGVAFSIELLEWSRTFSDFLG